LDREDLVSDDELIQRLVDSAAAAIRNERPSIVYDRQRLRGITVELTVSNAGGMVEGEVYLQRTANLRKLTAPGPAGRFLLETAERIGRPLGVNVPTADGNSQSMLLAPRGWTQERLAGWVADHHEAIEAQFGPATSAEGGGLTK
jgi:hypothetical protein